VDDDLLDHPTRGFAPSSATPYDEDRRAEPKQDAYFSWRTR